MHRPYRLIVCVRSFGGTRTDSAVRRYRYFFTLQHPGDVAYGGVFSAMSDVTRKPDRTVEKRSERLRILLETWSRIGLHGDEFFAWTLKAWFALLVRDTQRRRNCSEWSS